jgi:hypothetical protein
VQVLSFAAVGPHGRELRTALGVCAFLIVWAAASLTSQTVLPFTDLTDELAVKVAAKVPRGAKIGVTAGAVDVPADAAADVARALRAQGLLVVDAADAVPTVRVSCSANLRERVCVAEIQAAAGRDVLLVTRPHDAQPTADAGVPLALDLRPIFSQRSPILDVAAIGERLLVLDPDGVTLYQQTSSSWQRVQARPVAPARVWPRDLRGRLRVEGESFDAFLPGVTCSGPVNLLSVSCVEGQRPWPVGVENTGIDATRNHFSTPEGLTFYGIAPLDGEADARWLMVDRTGTLTFLSDDRQPVARSVSAEDLVAMATSCQSTGLVLVASRDSKTDDGVLRAYQVVHHQLVPAAAPVGTAGAISALWAAPGARAATVVVHNLAIGRYEAYQASLACGR